MRAPCWWIAFNTLFLLVVTADLTTYAQQLVTTKPDGKSAPAVSIEFMVLGVPSSVLRGRGLYFPEAGTDAPGSPRGFAIVLPEGEAQSMAANPGTIVVHKLKVDAIPGDPAKFRVDARTPSSSSPDDSAPMEPYWEVSLGFEVTSNVAANRAVTLSTVSVVEIRGRTGSAGSLGALLLDTQPLKNQIQVPEGRTLLLGGLFTEADSSRLPNIPVIPDSPIFRYILSKAPRQGDDSEIVVLLTPRIIRPNDGATGAFPSGVPVTTMRGSDIRVSPNTTVAPMAAAKPIVSPAPTASEAASPKPASKPDSRFYAVQVGAFQNRDKAEALLTRLKKKFEGAVVDQASSGPSRYRVRIVRVPDLASARRLRARLLKQGFHSFVVLPGTP